MNVRRFIQQKGIAIAIITTVVLVGCSALLSFYVRYQTNRFNDIKDQVSEVKILIDKIEADINVMDMGIRGYMLVPNDKMLYPYLTRYQTLLSDVDTLGLLLENQYYPATEDHQRVRLVIADYLEILNTIVQLTGSGQSNQALEILTSDPGYDAWVVYSKHFGTAKDYEDKRYEEAKNDYQRIVDTNATIQIILLILGIPTLLFVMYRINKASKNRTQLFEGLEESQRKYLFNDNTVQTQQNESSIIGRLITDLEKASCFVRGISQGDYTVSWEGITEGNRALNQDNLTGALMQMREQMKKVKQEDQQRLWSTEGLSKVAEITRQHQNDLQKLADSLLSYLVTYTQANQGSLFFSQEDEAGQPLLVLTACYAYDKKKHADKTAKVGQGLVGQTYLERKTLHLTQLPDQYVSITSGLGEATPTALLLVPMLFNEQVLGILEIASFEVFAPHQIAFLESVGEVIASAVATVRMNSQTRVLLEQSQEGTEALRAQEEEMRQNMEELQATQEEMQRKAQEYEAVIEEQQHKIQTLEQVR